MKTFQQLTVEYTELRNKRLSLEREAKAIESGPEYDARCSILTHMAQHGMKTASVDGVGRFTITDKLHYEIADRELFFAAMLQNMRSHTVKGRPLSEGSLLQLRAHRDNIEQFLSENPQYIECLEAVGLRKVVSPNISFTGK